MRNRKWFFLAHLQHFRLLYLYMCIKCVNISSAWNSLPAWYNDIWNFTLKQRQKGGWVYASIMKRYNVETLVWAWPIPIHLNGSLIVFSTIFLMWLSVDGTQPLGITHHICFVPRRLPVIREGHNYQRQFFHVCPKLFESHRQFCEKSRYLNQDFKTNIDKFGNVLYYPHSREPLCDRDPYTAVAEKSVFWWSN